MLPVSELVHVIALKILWAFCFERWQKHLSVVFCQIGALKYFSKFYWKYLCRSLMLVKLTPSLCKLTEQKRWYSCFPANGTLTLVFSCKFTVYFQNTFSEEHLWRAVSEFFLEHLPYITPPAMVVKINKKVLENSFFHQVYLKITFS